MKRAILAAMVIGMVVSAAWCEEKVVNPQYKSWSSHKVGTSVTSNMVSEMDTGGTKMTTKSTSTTTLKKLTPEMAVVEVVMEMDAGGMKHKMPPQTREIPAKIAKGKTEMPNQPAGVKATKKGEGDETLTIGGKKYKCHWVEMQVTSPQMESTSKVWTCPDVPGQMVKTVSNTTKPMKATTTIELVEIKPAS